ncbi:hypothetical protein BDV28DRAFT_138764 [Aspergillus coremiiformis]|uniref:Uncharacterized protein n=1 Tax=Aspergillus coremiiformis TaxID=138285 RepID=A0A5N6Z3T2_9EURO|nr:hypothetical protein BDV28DRAFT_138764 [Aspergillus coremiiformis]
MDPGQNRLLHMIRTQQTQLQQLQQQQHQGSQSTAIDDSDRTAFPMIPPVSGGSGSRTSAQFTSRRPSRPSSQAASPSLRPLTDAPRGPEGPEWIAGTSESPARRDEGAFYQAEAAMLTRENQILRQRIRDLERQVSELTTSSAGRVRSGEISALPAADGGEPADPPVTVGTGSISEPADKT